MTSATGSNRPARQGLALVEVLVATVVLFAGLGAVLKAYSAAVAALDTATDALNSSEILRQKAADIELAALAAQQDLRSESGACEPPYARYDWRVTSRRPSDWGEIPGAAVLIEVWRPPAQERWSLTMQWASFPVGTHKGDAHR